MRARRLLAAAATAALLAAPAYAQDGTPSDTSGASDSAPSQAGQASREVLVEIDDEGRFLDTFNATVEELKAKSVYGANGEEIGDIAAILATPDGRVAAIVVDVGGFLGIGDKDVVVPVEDIRFQGLRMSLNMTQEEIEALPDWGG